MARINLLERLLILTTLLSWPTCHGGPEAPPTYPFNDVSLSWHERLDDLVGRLTLDEIGQQMANGGRETFAPGIPRLGIKPYPWGAECNRGDVQAGPATSYPQAIGLAATFSPETMYLVAEATGVEVRAKYNNYSAHGDYGQHTSASCWSPVINIMRDPRWGRNQETYGEDPFLSGVMAASFVIGLQGEHPRYIRANAGCKHFDAYGGPENIPASRFSFDAKISERDWRMTFLPAFRMCVEAGSYSVMCSFNSINGIPACANRKLLTEILREEWGFNGYVISDEGALELIMTGHNYTNTTVDTVAVAVAAGLNLEDGQSGIGPIFLQVPDAVKQGKLSEFEVRRAVRPMFYTRMRLGLFDPDDINPYAALDPKDVVQSLEHRELSLLAALRSVVLLKNNGYLPLHKDKRFSRLAVVGPMANNTEGIFGGYAPEPDAHYISTPYEGLRMLSPDTRLALGCVNSDTRCMTYNETEIKQAVTMAELVVVCLGTGDVIEAEGNDRPDINLPGKQLQLLQDAAAYSGTAPVILVLFNAGPLDVNWAQDNPRVVAIIEAFFPAQASGEALRMILQSEGPAANPAGRLPATWPANIEQYPPITDYTMINRTYRYLDGDVLYSFGYGLSYSRFHYRSLDIRPEVVRYDNAINVDVYVSNEGPYDGEEVVQVYVEWMNTSLPSPIRQLIAFDRYFIPVGQGITAHFLIPLDRLSVWNDAPPGYVTLRGDYLLYAGGQQPGRNRAAPSNVLVGIFAVV